MKNIRKTIAFIFAAVLLGGILPGCTDKKKGGQNTTVTENNKVIINFWEQDAPNAQKILDKLIADFQKENEGIVVKRTHVESEDMKKNYTSASLGKNGPDLVLGPKDNLTSFINGKLIVPAVDIVGEDFFKMLDLVSLDIAEYNGKQYMIPDRQGNELMLIYNKKIVAQPPKTFEELVSLSKKLQEDKKVQYGLAINEAEPLFTIPFLSVFGGKVLDNLNVDKPRITLDTNAVKEWMVFMKGLYDDGIIPKDTNYDSANNLFKEGKAAFIINGSWSFDEYKKANIDFGTTTIPSISGKYPAPYASVKGYTISANVAGDKDKKSAIIKFLTYMNSKDTQLKLAEVHSELPTNVEAIKDVKIENNQLLVNQKDQLSKSISMPVANEMSAVWTGIKEIQQEVFKGRIKPEEAPSKMQKKAEEEIKKLVQ